MRAPLVATAAVLLPLVTGCLTPYTKVRATALERAAFDLGCPSESLTATRIGDTTRVGATPQSPGVERSVIGVTGCSQKAVYVVECVTDACNAVLNADTQAAPPPPAGP